MTDTDQEREEEVLRRMLKTPHKPHAPADYVLLAGKFFVADMRQRAERSIVADLYRNTSDFRSGRCFERSAHLTLA